MADVTLTMDARTGRAVTAYLKFVDAQERVEQGAYKIGRATRRTEREVGDSGRKMSDSFGDVVRSVSGITAGLALMIKLLGKAKEEYQDMVARQERAAEAQRTTAQLEATALLNLPPGITKPQVEQFVGGLATTVGVPERSIWSLLGPALSASGRLPWEMTQQAVRTGAIVQALTGQGGDLITGAVLDIGRAIPELQTGDQAMGWVRQVALASRVTSIEGWAEHIPRAAAALTRAGWGKERAGELFAAYSMAGYDPSGAETVTALVAMDKMLTAPIIPRRGRGGLGWETIPVELSPEEKMAYLQEAYAGAPAELQAAMLAKVPGRGQMRTVTQAWIKREPLFGEELATAERRVVPPGPESGAIWAQYLAQASGVPGMETVRVGQAFDGLVEAVQRGGRGRTAAIRQGLWDVLAETPSALEWRAIVGGERGAKLFWEAHRIRGQDPLDAATDIIENLAKKADDELRVVLKQHVRVLQDNSRAIRTRTLNPDAQTE